MKSLTTILTIFLLTGAAVSLQAQGSEPLQPVVKILYFHGNNRCTTCNNMEKYTRELVNDEYKKEVDKGVLTFEVFNFDDEAQQAIVSKYGIESSTLLLIKMKNGKEKITDLTDIGFTYAKYDPEKFKGEVQKRLNEKLR